MHKFANTDWCYISKASIVVLAHKFATQYCLLKILTKWPTFFYAQVCTSRAGPLQICHDSSCRHPHSRRKIPHIQNLSEPDLPAQVGDTALFPNILQLWARDRLPGQGCKPDPGAKFWHERYKSDPVWAKCNHCVQILKSVGALNLPEWYDAGLEAQKGSFAPFGKAPSSRQFV